MAKKMINSTHVEGYVYEHELELKVSGPNSKNPGTEFINGTLNIATDDALTNVVPVHFTYVTALTTKKQPNATYNLLKAIIDGKIGSVMEHGKENAGKVRIDSAIALNEWFDTRTEGNPLVSVKRNEGGFVHSVSELCKPEERATFNTDILITSTRRVEANEERGLPEKVVVKGYIFNFRGDILPIEYSVIEPAGALDYFENIGATEKTPVFTRVQGKQVSQTVVRTIEEEGAWGDTHVREVKSSYRDFVINWAYKDGYTWDDEETILASELAEKMAKRELDLADAKKRQDEWQANKNNAIAATNTLTPKKDNYDF